MTDLFLGGEGGILGEGGVGGRGQACTDGTHKVLFCSSSTASLICVHIYAMFTPAGISAEKIEHYEYFGHFLYGNNNNPNKNNPY